MGYATVAVVTLTVLLLGARLYRLTQLERDHVWVHFSGTGDLISSLQKDDPVAIQGVNVGQVEDIQSDTTGVRARLRFWKHQKIYCNAHVENVGNGLMGMRYLLLEPGNDSFPHLDRDALIEGTFKPGIAEVMSGIKEVVAMVREIQVWIEVQAKGSESQVPLHSNVMAKIAATDSILTQIDRLTKKAERIGPGLQTGGNLAKTIADSMRNLEPSLIGALASTDTILRQAKDLLIESGRIARHTDTLVKNVMAPLEPLTRNDSLLRKIEATLSVVDLVEGFVEGKTSMKANFKLWGANPSKRGE